MSAEERAKEAIMKVARRKAEKDVLPKVEEKAKLKLSSLGVSEEDLKKAALAAKLAHDFSNKEFDYDLNENLGIHGRFKEDDKALGIRLRKKFD